MPAPPSPWERTPSYGDQSNQWSADREHKSEFLWHRRSRLPGNRCQPSQQNSGTGHNTPCCWQTCQISSIADHLTPWYWTKFWTAVCKVIFLQTYQLWFHTYSVVSRHGAIEYKSTLTEVMVSHRTGNKLRAVISLSHCGLVTPYGDMELGRHWLRQWLVAWRHQAITWTNVDSSLVRSHGILLRALLFDDVKIPVNKTRLKIAVLKWHPGLRSLIYIWYVCVTRPQWV